LYRLFLEIIQDRFFLSSLQYRPDIDCLRAFAVVSVIGYHYQVPPFRGGFVGVDVFFVISGFLITRIIWSEHRADIFSFAAFYRRRVRRILPAAFAMLCAVLACASFVSLPQETVGVAQQALAVLTFVSNVLFWSQQNYFDSAAITKPLLHTWSLALEEQYYLLFPMAAVAAFSLRRSWMVLSFAAVGIASLALCIVQTTTEPASAFYLLPARAWQLLLGALLAIEAVPQPKQQWPRIIGCVIGWLLLGVSVNAFTTQTPYPGSSALLPCLAAALVIWSNPAPGRLLLLAVRPIIMVGLWSYSLYLWHWPIASFAYAVWGPPDTALAKAALIACCITLSIASYYLIEQPARRADWPTVARALAATGAAAAAFSAAMIWTAGFPSRFAPEELRTAGFLNYDHGSIYEDRVCFLAPDQSVEMLTPACIAPGRGANILLWGDSHAAHLAFGLRQTLSPANVMRASMAQCLPYESFGETTNCAAFNRSMLDLIRRQRPDIVILSANWGQELSIPSVRASLMATIRSIAAAGSKVVVIGPSPQYDHVVPRIIVAASHFGARAGGRLLPFLHAADDRLREQFKDDPNAEYISVLELMCPQDKCPLSVSGTPVAWDEGHFTAEGSEMAGRLIAAASETIRGLQSNKPAISQ
jgi:peptidoglycan/LPS O-acetylase OafA/YrhL